MSMHQEDQWVNQQTCPHPEASGGRDPVCKRCGLGWRYVMELWRAALIKTVEELTKRVKDLEERLALARTDLPTMPPPQSDPPHFPWPKSPPEVPSEPPPWRRPRYWGDHGGHCACPRCVPPIYSITKIEETGWPAEAPFKEVRGDGTPAES